MVLRELVGKSVEELNALGCHVDGRRCESVTYDGPGSNAYTVYFGTGDILQGKGHTRFESLAFPRQAKSSDRIQRYGEFGTSI
jgi:hypothetical protein